MKVPFIYLNAQVDILFNKMLNDEVLLLADRNELDKRCEFIRSFIESSGWDIDDYIWIMMGFGDKNGSQN